MKPFDAIVLVFFAQAAVLFVDEFYFHWRRGLPRWERIGHPLDTLSVLACYGVLCALPREESSLWIYGAVSLASCLFVTKDEFVHKRLCSGMETWLHALLFILHPLSLAAAGWIWTDADEFLLHAFTGQIVLTSLFFVYQIVYWNLIRKPAEQPVS